MTDSYIDKLERYQRLKEIIISEFIDDEEKLQFVSEKFKIIDERLDKVFATILNTSHKFWEVMGDRYELQLEDAPDKPVEESRHPEMMMFIVIGYMIGIIFAQLIIR